MNEKFFDLPRDKQDRMIKGALDVFAKYDFKHASTDDMVKIAEISKGLWYHYFGSKLGLYTFVYDYSVKYILLELSTMIDSSDTDFFDIIKKMEHAKTKIRKNYPSMLLFLEQANLENDESVLELIAENKQNYLNRIESLIKNSTLPADVARPERIKNMVQYMLDGLVRSKTAAGYEPDTIYREEKIYLDMVKDFIINDDEWE